MGLKFRRGSTAQQSGSLAFGEPYVNTTLGTLIVGGATGDIVLSSTGTGSTGNFGAISGSGLDITGNANVAGNLTLGGKLTIGDNSSDTVNVVASLSSSLIPSITNAFDLGSETKIWRDLYISTGSIKFVGTGGAIVGTLSNSGNGMSLDGGVITRGDSSFGTSSLAITSVTGSLAVNGRIIATSISGAIAATNGVVSGSSQVIGILDSLNTFSGSQLTQNTALATISGSLISSASANTISVANLNSATASLLIETTNLETFSGSANTRFTEIGVVSGSLITSASAAKTTNDSQGVSITNLNSATASLIIETTNLELFSGSANTRFTEIGVVSGSLITSQSNATISVANLNAASSSYETNGRGIVSGSSQIDITSTTNYTTFSSSIATSISASVAGATWDNLVGKPAGIVSGSSQLTGSYDTRYVISGSITQTTWDNIASKPSGIVSGSVQVDITATTGFNTFSGSIATSFSIIDGGTY